MKEWGEVSDAGMLTPAANHDGPRNSIEEVSQVELHHHPGGMQLHDKAYAMDEGRDAAADADTNLLRPKCLSKRLANAVHKVIDAG